MDATNDLELSPLSAAVAAAASPEDLFGDLGTTEGARRRSLATIFRRLAQVLHPDKHAEPAAKAVAHAAFVRAATLRGEAHDKILAGTYGDRTAAAAPTVITTARRTYSVGARLAKGDICDVYGCAVAPSDGGAERPAALKIAQSSADNDLVEREAEILRALYPADQPEERFFRYLPRLAIEQIIAEARARYHVFFVIPRGASNRSDPALQKRWQSLLGAENVLMLDDPNAVCEAIGVAIGLCEGTCDADAVEDDLVTAGATAKLAKTVKGALEPLAKSTALARVGKGSLSEKTGRSRAVERL